MENQEFDVENEFNKKLKLGKNLLESINNIENRINGLNKLRSKVKQEISFLENRKTSQSLKKEHLVCSNLIHYEALVSKLLRTENPISVLEVCHYKNESEQRKIIIDIVSHKKTRWCKVIARNPKALSQISKGEGEYQQKSVLDHADEFLECAHQNMVLFSPPQVEFDFACGVERNLAEELNQSGIYVGGTIIDDCGSNALPADLIFPTMKNNSVKKVNLDVSAMIAYVSALTNGHADKKLRGKVLNQQAAWERRSPVKPILDKFFEGMELYCCETAMDSFMSIVNILGGEGEKRRAEELRSRITVVKDVACTTIKPGGQTKPRNLVIFGTGQAMQAITVTSNSAFVRAANTQGVHLDIFLHEPRVLTEGKEIDD